MNGPNINHGLIGAIDTITGRTMRDLFRGYYQPTPEEVTKIWESGSTVLDANVLLSLYKVSPATSNFYLEALEKRSAKNWLPYQVAMEFHNNVHKIRSEQTAGHAKRITEVKKFRDALRNTESKSRLQKSAIQTQIEEDLDKLVSELEGEQKSIRDQTHHHKPDELLGRISELFTGQIGPMPSSEELITFQAQGKIRYENLIPPGYEDTKTKSGGGEYGDYIFWQQVLDYAKSTETDIVLVTDDNKADWWIKIDGDSVAPRPELIQEFRAFTGQEIVIWPSRKFYNHLTAEPEHVGKSAEAQAAADDMRAAVTKTQAASSQDDDLDAFLRRHQDLTDPDTAQQYRDSELAYRGSLLDEMDELTRIRFEGSPKYKTGVARGKFAYQSLKRADLARSIAGIEERNSTLAETIERVSKAIEHTNNTVVSDLFVKERDNMISEFTNNAASLAELRLESQRLEDLN